MRQPRRRLLLAGTVAIGAFVIGIGLFLCTLRVQAAPLTHATAGTPITVSTPTATSHPLLPTPTPAARLPTPTAPPVTALAVTPTPETEAAYVVGPGDTLLTVALEIGVDLDEMACVVAPDFTWEQPLVIGDVLSVPPAGTVCHRVEPGDSLLTMADHYGVSPASIHGLAWNELQQTPLAQVQLTPGLHLRVPAGGATAAELGRPSSDQRSADQLLVRMLSQPVGAHRGNSLALGGPGPAPVPVAVPEDWPYGSGVFAWPAYGWLSQDFHGDHRAVDIAAPAGTLVAAADRGVVIRAGWNDQGYGNFVVVDHNIDYITLYAHLDDIYVDEGQVVAQGEILGTVGSTGRSTGPHLHFEIRDFGRRTDPIPLLLRDR